CPVGTLAPLATATLTVTATVPPGLTQGTTVSDTATVSAATADPLPANDSATATTPTPEPRADLPGTKTAPATVVPGAQLSYVVTVTNNGPSTAAGVVLTDALGAGLSGATAPGCSASPLTPGGGVPNPGSGTATRADPVAGNDSATATATTAAPSADLAVTKTGPATIT